MRLAAARFKLLATLLAAATATLRAQTEVALPEGTGHLKVPAGWTILGKQEIAAEQRASDPTAEPAATLVTGIVGALRDRGRTEQNVVLHQPGNAPGKVRTINAYSAAVAATAADLQSGRAIEEMKSALLRELAGPSVEVAYLGDDRPQLFPIGCVALTFRLTIGEHELRNRLVVVPAGKRLQYFESLFAADDLDAPTAIDEVLSTFDGAKEPVKDDTLTKMLIGGVAGAVGGIVVALMRRRRWQQRAVRQQDPPAAD
ncbi:MAG: hypothetical protein KDE27_05090 [Planctomycetes bacterium]|nr:hypothetical protein [Planctomycetota bacterium]